MSIKDSINNIINTEGGYVNHKNDRGGPTNFGITQATLSSWLGKRATIEDIKNLTKEEAYKIYFQKYYIRTSINQLPEEIQEIILDITINSWIKVATILLQRAINSLYYETVLTVDGRLGPKTIKFSENAIKDFGAAALINEIVEFRIKFYKSIVENDPTQHVFLAGWLNRANSFKV